MAETTIPLDSLVLYKNRPARVRHIADKLELELPAGESIRVRPKDVSLLHPGPMENLAGLRPPNGEVHTAWELLAGSETTLSELAELIYGDFTPQTAWGTWQLLVDGLLFHGDAGRIEVRTAEEVSAIEASRAADAAQREAWTAFIGRAGSGVLQEEDTRYLREVEALALGRTSHSRVLHDMGRDETPESAHELLLQTGFWDETLNPYPQRLGLPVTPVDLPLPPLPDEDRLDLTHLPAFAIDDASTETPDDALSLDGDRLWVHVADAAALVAPESPLDLAARARVLTLHLPEMTVPMLPLEATPRLALGLSDVSPALSFGLDLNDEGAVVGLEIVPSWVRVQRLTYEEAAARLGEPPLQKMYRLALRYRAHRAGNAAVLIDLPEVDIHVRDGQVHLAPVLPLASRRIVENAMVMVGEAVARYGMDHDIPLPYATQEAGEHASVPAVTLSDMFARRRLLRRSQYRSVPGPHAALGLPAYSQATSPLRRYLDLVVHQQLRAHLRGATLLTSQDILERVGVVEALVGSLRAAEQLSNDHWTAVYLMRHRDWQGEGVVVEKRGSSALVVIPALAQETQLHVRDDVPLDSTVPLVVGSVNLAQRRIRFRVTGKSQT